MVVPSHPKSAAERKAILEALKSNFMFKTLSAKACDLAVDAMLKVEMADGDNIMKQGDSGDDFFVMTEGAVHFYVGVAKVGEASGACSFGEPALVYNSPRNATVKCAAKCILWKISRGVFRKALAEESTAKHLNHIKMLTEVGALSSLSANQINTIAGAVKEKEYSDGDRIIVRSVRARSARWCTLSYHSLKCYELLARFALEHRYKETRELWKEVNRSTLFPTERSESVSPRMRRQRWTRS